MSEQPPTADNPVGDATAGPAEELVDDPLDDEVVEVTDSFGAPDIQATVAFVLSIVSVCNFGVLRGSNYFEPFYADADAHSRWLHGLLGVALGAVLALVPVVLGWRASARVLETDARWVAVAARAAVILGLLSLILQLVLAVLTAAAPEDPLALRGF